MFLGDTSERCPSCGAPSFSFQPLDVSIYHAMSTVTEWHHEYPPFGETGDFGTDLRLADGFRMLLYLKEPSACLFWIERELIKKPGNWQKEYEATLISWWLDIHENITKVRDHYETPPWVTKTLIYASPPFPWARGQ